MHTTSEQTEQIFQPITITITLESAQEAKALATLCNYSPIVDAGRETGIDLSNIFNVMAAGSYDPDNWNEDVKVLAETLANHPALNRPIVNAPRSIDIAEALVDTVEEIVAMIDDPVPEDEITYQLEKTGFAVGKIHASNGTTYKYKIAGCGEAIRISTAEGERISEIPTSRMGTYELNSDDLEVIAIMLASANK